MNIKEQMKDIITKQIHYNDNGLMGAFFLDQAINNLFDTFHISEKLTEDEKELIRLEISRLNRLKKRYELTETGLRTIDALNKLTKEMVKKGE